MDLTGKLILAYLEEDNPGRGLFHVRPLLTQDGPLSSAVINAYADNGFLRVVPDKNEQYTFKERLRTLGRICLINLQDFAEDANKVRQNRNYAPHRGESHQYIIYSNAVQSLPEDLVYEVISGAKGRPFPDCLTPCCYLRDGGHIEGPFLCENGEAGNSLSPLLPDSARLYSVTLPDGKDHLFFWPEQQQEEEKEPPSAQDLIRKMDQELPPLEHSLKEETAFRIAPEEEAPVGKMAGTPFYRVSAERKKPMRAHNPLQAVVRRLGKSQEKQAAPSAKTAPKSLQNPVEDYRRALDFLWQDEPSQQQTVDYFLSRPGAARLVAHSLSGDEDDTILTAMRQQLQDMEAERLSLIMQLDKAKNDLDALREEALAKAKGKERKALEELEEKIAAAKTSLAKIAEQQSALLEERARLIDELERLGNEQRILAPLEGEELAPSPLAERIRKHLERAGFSCSREEAMHILILFCLYPQVQLSASCCADSALAARALANALGAAFVDQSDEEEIIILSGASGPAIALRQTGQFSRPKHNVLIAGDSLIPTDCAYEHALWPCLALSRGHISGLMPLSMETPVNMQSLRDGLIAAAATELPAEAKTLIQRLDEALSEQGFPLPCALYADLLRYLRIAGTLMDGGIASALDYAISALVIPFARYHQADLEVLTPLLHSLPLTSQSQCK